MRRLAVVLAVLLASAVIASTPAHAYAGAFFHTQSSGNRGVEVLAIQHLLTHGGHAVPTTGVFDAATVTAVRAFQTARGLGVDGIVGPKTWAALTPIIRPGDSGDAVRALQVELNAKRRLSLAVTGTYDAATTEAVRAFQTHAGISSDGITGPDTWKNLVWHYDYPAFPSGLCDQDPDGNGTANWGTAAAIAQLEQAATAFAATGNGNVPLGDVGREHGGDIPGHASHDVGLDVDIWPIRTDSAQCTAGRITWQSATYDRAATRELVKAIRAAAPGHVKLVFFNDPTLISEGLTTSYANHDNHLHVRYCELVHPSSLYTC
ncbi:penicillin-insensitive murein endopeptidase [Goodfellowiella coeruleoviolacea]|uniref:Peptidoglycan-binding (PGRP) domain of peptidoglycan hydrolases-containing protein n=1 Tax=Goodfellowiella coeruleoviolacea TaxID=334858 RepID=A0AAE3KIG1_9PSEU|nr:penicillin-insensitive murein endopeptidase [Goodfellowiella coeruleoviolacea]MCP2167359.1 Peptidoglycan-binding (PGRP) domain of peptidoglycan hydrolases-containing protein [Goodfellowiella coeruleoviolacea]